MAQTDWALVGSSLDNTLIARGVTAGFTPPNGGGSFVHAFDSKTTGPGFSGLYVLGTNFAPLRDGSGNATGCSLRLAIQKRTSNLNTGYAAFGFACLRSGTAASPAPTADDVGYLLGFEDADPHRILCRKGPPSAGLPSTPAGTILAASSQAYTPGTWVHVRLDVIANPNGDVVLNFFQNDLTVNPVTAPVWAAIPGMARTIDDGLGILTGSYPLVGGYAGFGIWINALGRRALFDHVEVWRAL